MSLSGELTTFPVGPFHYPMFTSGDLNSNKAIVFIGGLTNGLGAVPFTKKLSEEVGKNGWKFVQFHWSSAYEGYGTGSLNRDREEMELLVKHLRGTGIKMIILMGHSTGSQNVLHYLSNPSFNSPSPSPSSSSSNTDTDTEIKVEGGILQAPLSDREFFTVLKMTTYEDVLPLAKEMIEKDKGDEIMPEEFCKQAGFGDAPLKITAYRTWSLAAIGGEDDYFSSDIPDSPTAPYTHSLSSSFGAIAAPALILYSEKDTPYQASPPEELLPRWKAAAEAKGKDLEWKIVPGASHDVTEPVAQEALCHLVLEWLKRFDNT